jgi:Trypsin-like peptidase domain
MNPRADCLFGSPAPGLCGVHMTGPRRRLLWVVALTSALLVPGAGPASAHTHPTPTELAAPGVVYVEAGARVEVALVEHQRPAPHITIVQSSSNPVLASASGFVVDPTGAVVTSGVIRKPTGADLDRARIYAVNDAFQKRYGARVHLSDDLFSRQRIGSAADPLQQRLEACYPPNHTNDAGGCVVSVTPTFVVYPYVTDQAKYGRLTAELLPSSTSDVALVRVRAASGLPTVPLDDSRKGAHALAALGFTGIPDGRRKELQINAHLAEPGGNVFKTKDLDEKEAKASVDLAAGLKAGMRGGPLVAESGRVVGFAVPDADSGPPPAPPGRLVDVGAIREVLAKEKITPRQGPVDSTFEAASHAYKNKGYATAIPNLEKTLELFPGHAIAASNLADAKQKVAAGTPGPTPAGSSSPAVNGNGSDFPWLLVLLAVAVALVLAVVGAVVLRNRRRRLPPPAGGVPSSPGPPRPREGQPVTPSGPAVGARERHAVSSQIAGSGTGAGGIAVIEAGGSSPSRTGPAPSGAPSRAVAGQAPATGARDGSRASRVSPAATTGAAKGRSLFCTSCGSPRAPEHRFCGRCGAPAG